MMQLDGIRKLMADQRALDSVQIEQQLAEGAAAASVIKLFAGCSMVVSAISCIALRNLPFVGGMVSALGALGVVASYEVIVLSGNAVEIMKEARSSHRSGAVLSQAAFVQQFTKGTWIVGPFFGHFLEAWLEAASVARYT